MRPGCWDGQVALLCDFRMGQQSQLVAQLLGTALMEETVFRGFLWPELARRFGDLVAAWRTATASRREAG